MDKKRSNLFYEAKDDGTSNVSTTTGWIEEQIATRIGLDPVL